MTLFDVVSAVVEVTEDEHEAVAVVVHLLESGRVTLSGLERARKSASGDNEPDSLRRTG